MKLLPFLLFLGADQCGYRALTLSAQSLPVLPQTFYAAGAGLCSGVACSTATLGVQISAKAALYSYSAYSSTFYRGRPTTSAQTGFLTPLRCIVTKWGDICIDALGTGGLNSGQATSLALQFGGTVPIRWRSGWFMAPTMTWDKGSQEGPSFRLLVGWGK